MKIFYRAYSLLRSSLRRFGLDFLLLRLPRDFEQDGLSSSRARPFEEDSQFIFAKESVVAELGKDYSIDWRTHVFLWSLKSHHSAGTIQVELGTGKGWMVLFASHYFSDFQSRFDLWLFDRFLPKSVDPVSGEIISGLDPHYADSFEEVQLRFGKFSNINLVQGDLPSSLDQLPSTPISFIHVDLNASKPEVDSLDVLWGQLIPGGVVLLDDYGQPNYSASKVAMEAFAKTKGVQILGLPTGQGIMVKSRERSNG